MDDDVLMCSECGWFGPTEDAMPAEGAEVMHFCPDCASLVLAGE